MNIRLKNYSFDVKIALAVVILLAILFNVYQFLTVRTQNIEQKNQIEALESALSVAQNSLSSAWKENMDLNQSLILEKANTTFFQEQIQNITGTVQVLEKLSKTDSELLKKYSKVYFLNENYFPSKLVQIDKTYLYPEDKQMEIHSDVWPHLLSLLKAAESENIPLKIISAYRSFGTQANLKSSYKVLYGAGTANRFSADQGYSEHQLGTTVDFTTPSLGTAFVGFEKTESYKWLLANAHRFGFIISYPANNSYYAFEPWHFRFVGVSLATRLFNDKISFYDMDQRIIDSYLSMIFD